MPANRRKVQRDRAGRSIGSDPAKRPGNHAAYRPEPAKETIVNGVRCVNVDGGRLADVAAAYRVWGLT